MKEYKVYYWSNENELLQNCATYLKACSAKSAAKKALGINGIKSGYLEINSGMKRSLFEISGGKLL